MRWHIVLTLFLAACAPTQEVGPYDASAIGGGYAEAMGAGDAPAALAALRSQARAGDLEAIAALADAHERGYLADPADATARPLPIHSWPWDAANVRRRYQRALREGAADGDPEALFRLANRLLARRSVDGTGVTPATDRVEAQALYDRLAAMGADPLRLAGLADQLGDREASRRHLEAAVAVGDPQACIYELWASGPEGPLHAASTIAASIDAAEACRTLADGPLRTDPRFGYGASALADLRRQTEAGNPAAAATLDSLTALGVFERHPRLAAVAD